MERLAGYLSAGSRFPLSGQRAEQHAAYSSYSMLWLGGAIKQPAVVDKLMNQTDMAATLLGQLGIDHREFNFSRNVLGKNILILCLLHL